MENRMLKRAKEDPVEVVGPAVVHDYAARLGEAYSAGYALGRASRDGLREALSQQASMWESLPSGIDVDASPDDTSPGDAFAHIGGLAVQGIIRALADDDKNMNDIRGQR